MGEYSFAVFPDEDLLDLRPFQYGWEQCTPLHSFGPYVRNHYLFHYIISGRGFLDSNSMGENSQRYDLEYEGLVWDHPCDSDIFDGYVELMTEAVCSSRETVRICGQELPTAAVRSRFLKLNREHVEYVRDCLCNTTAAIGNIKAYTLAALYNAPVTMEGYYAARVNHDLYGGEPAPPQGRSR